jgi:DNA-binding YbaB/EbfC family protein
MPDLSQIVLKAQQMQDAYERAKESLAESEVAGSAGGGLVTALVSGDGELKSVTISPEAVDPDDLETLGDLVVAAVRDASRQVKAMGDQLMTQATSGLDLNSLGLDSLGLGGLPGMPGGGAVPGAGGSEPAGPEPTPERRGPESSRAEQLPGTGSGD